MITRILALALGIVFLLAVVLLADPDEQSIAIDPIEIQQPIIAQSSMASCTMARHNGVAATGWGMYEEGTGTVTYFDPEIGCGPSPYPFEITALSFTLGEVSFTIWPCSLEVVVFMPATPGDPCSGPGPELCRWPLEADSASYADPNVGTFVFPEACCVEGPCFIGIEVAAGDYNYVPTLLFDSTSAPVECVNWQLYTDGVWREWYDFWVSYIHGYPILWVDGETVSSACMEPCVWNPGDPYKMHFPQLPDPNGWDVNATAPAVLADDWQCSETGWVKDFHFWGAWRDGVEGEITSFDVAIYSDIAADPPEVPYSRPGQLLWRTEVTQFQAEWFDLAELEGWYDPEIKEVLWDNNAGYFQYNVCIPEGEWFWQEEQTIYWLAITANVVDPVITHWGWKSTLDHFNDDAVNFSSIGLTCTAPDNGIGTVDLPPPCPYFAPEGLMVISDGLPEASTIGIKPILDSYFSVSEVPGGLLGGTIVSFEAIMTMNMTGTGELSGFTRTVEVPVSCVWHTGPRNPGDPIQTFPTDFFFLYGTVMGDPDFDFLTITAGDDNGLPSPGSTTVTDLGGGLYHIDSFFDITYRIDFTGAPGSILEGTSGSSPGTVQMATNENPGEAPWSELYEPDPPDPRTNSFGIMLDETGAFMGGSGTDYFEDGTSLDGWYHYPSGWWNIWFYDHPFDYDRKKESFIAFDIYVTSYGLPIWGQIAVNFSTDWWSLVGDGGDSIPPLPGMAPEDSAIGRVVLLEISDYGELGHYEFPWTFTDYNPEWVSIDVRGENINVDFVGGEPGGAITHDCVGPGDVSMDLAFVITGGSDVVDSGACCYQDPPWPEYYCLVTTEDHCVNTLGGVYQGNGSICGGMEACCLPTGECIMADSLCCTDVLGGVPQGEGSVCTAPEACCLPDGTCQDLDPICCNLAGGTPMGQGTDCSSVTCGSAGACCPGDGSCLVLSEEDCLALGEAAVYRGDGSSCLGDTSPANGYDDRCECCGLYTGGITGNANCSPDGKLTLSDISRMIDYLYISKLPLCCYTSGNTNGSWDDGECKITLSDISRLIDVLYISKLPPEDCMPECEQ